jgi:DUF1680 family protein
MLGGVVTISGPADVDDDSDWHDALYRTTAPKTVATTIKAIPYYAWDNRAASEMRVWVRVKA